jgi:hypothetical protein
MVPGKLAQSGRLDNVPLGRIGGGLDVVIVGNKLAPGVADGYLARNGYEAQQHGGAVSPEREHNLHRALDDTVDHGAHGAFDGRAREASLQVWADRHRGVLALAGLGALALGLVTRIRR